MFSQRIADAFQRLRESELASRRGGLRGCSPDEIEDLEERISLRLPASYVQFLRLIGRSCGDFLVGSDILYEDLASIGEAARALVEEEGSLPLVDSAFVFAMHQGYQFLFFRTDVGDDPPVMRFLEESGIACVSESFSDWFMQAVREELQE